MMKNADIYLRDPRASKLLNEGVANVNDAETHEQRTVLRYELETFVCDGQYRQGLEDILQTYLSNIGQAQQPGVWVSGFFGSGKSHLVKILRALWVDTQFSDGATARGITNLPQEIQDHLRELSVQGKRHGGLHAASGTLGASASGSVRLALLRLVFQSVGLPSQYPLARFVMWLRNEDILDDVRSRIEAAGLNWQEELDNFYVAEGLHEALVEAKPKVFASPEACVETLRHQFPFVEDISRDELQKALSQALTRDGKFPLTLIVLDEVQQFIGTDAERSMAVQEMVEALSQSFQAKLLFVGTGQTAITGTHNLARLQARFTVPVELNDTDVDTVIRKVILAKKPEALPEIDRVMQENLGEISRHLQGTGLGHSQKDVDYFPHDYPILPVRRRLWEASLRALDPTGTDSQLRNQLSLVHKTIQTNLDEELGHVIAADYLYFESAERLLQARVLPRKVYERTKTWQQGTEDEQLLARACGLIFLLNKLANANPDLGIQVTSDTLADLLVEDLREGSGGLRARLSELLDDCNLLMRVGDEYRIQTEESAAWNDAFQAERANLANQAHRIELERDDRVRQRFIETTRALSVTQGDSAVPRELQLVFDTELPSDAKERVYVWVRDEWSIDEKSVRAEARQAGNDSPTVFVFIPKRSADDLRHCIMDYKAATATLEQRGVPNTAEGDEARAGMETVRNSADRRIKELLDEAFAGAKVFQGGGTEVVEGSLADNVRTACENAVQRLYPQFSIADNPGWAKVYERAQKGAPDALKAVGYDGEPTDNAVCKAVLNHIAGGKTGSEIRTHFESAPYGWSRDAIDGALQCLLVAGQALVKDERGGDLVDPRNLERKAIGRARFEVESTTITTPQRIQIRKVLQKAGISVKHQGEELASVDRLVEKLTDLHARAGGEPPQPEPPNATLLESVRLSSGNDKLAAVYNQRDELSKSIDDWTKQADKIAERWPRWEKLQRLIPEAAELNDGDMFVSQFEQIRDQRLLLQNPDPIEPLLNNVVQHLRDELNGLDDKFKTAHQAGMKQLEADDNWAQLEPEQRNSLLAEQRLTKNDFPQVAVGSIDEVIQTVTALPISAFSDRVKSLPARFEEVARGAAELLEPETQYVRLPRRTLKSEDDIENWLTETRERIQEALADGPVYLQ